MIASLKAYPLTSIIKQFEENGWGDRGLVVQALEEGSLIGSIKFPSYIGGWHPIPPEFWDDEEIYDELVPITKQFSCGEINDFIAKPSFCRDPEIRRLKTIAKAAANHDINLIDEELRPTVERNLKVNNLEDYVDWYNLIRVFHQLCLLLDSEADEWHKIYVTSEDWSEFCKNQPPKKEITQK